MVPDTDDESEFVDSFHDDKTGMVAEMYRNGPIMDEAFITEHGNPVVEYELIITLDGETVTTTQYVDLRVMELDGVDVQGTVGELVRESLTAYRGDFYPAPDADLPDIDSVSNERYLKASFKSREGRPNPENLGQHISEELWMGHFELEGEEQRKIYGGMAASYRLFQDLGIDPEQLSHLTDEPTSLMADN